MFNNVREKVKVNYPVQQCKSLPEILTPIKEKHIKNIEINISKRKKKLYTIEHAKETPFQKPSGIINYLQEQ